MARVQHAERAAERYQDECEFAGGREHRTGAQRIGLTHAGGSEQQPNDPRLERRDDDGRDQNEPDIGAHDSQIDAHSDAHEEQGQQQPAEWLDVGFQLVSVVGFGEQDAG